MWANGHFRVVRRYFGLNRASQSQDFLALSYPSSLLPAQLLSSCAVNHLQEWHRFIVACGASDDPV